LTSRFREEQPVGASQAWTRHGALKDGQLVAQRQIFEHQGAAGSEHAEEGCEDEGDHAGIINQVGRQFNVDEADGVNRRHTPNNRTGSHNLVVGRPHPYSSFGGFVAGMSNAVTGPGASVSGGGGNTASGVTASVSGGQVNTASGDLARVSGGSQRSATGLNDWVDGSLFEDN
jgi:hypothetical protein